MPVTQIDLLTAAPKTQESLPVKTAELQKPVNDNINAYAQVERNAQDNSEITIKPNPSESPEFSYESGDREGGGGKYFDSKSAYYRKRRKNAKDDEEPETDDEKKLGHGFDIRV